MHPSFVLFSFNILANSFIKSKSCLYSPYSFINSSSSWSVITLYTLSYDIFFVTLITALNTSEPNTSPLLDINISTARDNLSSPAFKLQMPLDNCFGSIGITLPGIYILVPLAIASLFKAVFSFT